MHMPNLKDAKIRTNKKVETKIASNLKSEKFKNKKYFMLKI